MVATHSSFVCASYLLGSTDMPTEVFETTTRTPMY